MSPTSYTEVLARNIRAARSRADLSQQSIAERMRALGFEAWMHQTVGNVERAKRGLRAEEVLGLAACLETTVHHLMSPLAQDGPVELPSGEPLTFGQVRSLIFGHGPKDDDPRSSVIGARDLRGIRWQDNNPVFAGADHAAAANVPTKESELPSVATAIVTSSRGVLVGRRNDGKPPWTFIAGEVEPGETAPFAATREVKEETGLETEASHEIGQRVHPKTGRTMVYIAARPVRPDDLDIFVGDSDELAEVRWVSLAEADELMAAYGMFEPVHEYLAREIGEA